MSAPIPVLAISPWPSFWEGAYEVGCSDQDEVYRGLVRHGFDVHYVLPALPGTEPPGPPSHFRTGPNVLGWATRWPAPARRPWRYWSFTRIYSGLATEVGRRLRPRLVVGESYHAARAAVLAAHALGVPCVTKFYGLMSLSRAGQPEWLHRLRHWETLDALRAPADRVVVLDDGTRGDVAALRYGVPRERLCFWPNGVDLGFRTRQPAVDRQALRREAGAAEDTVIIAGLSRLVRNKGVDVALEALARLDSGLPFLYVLLGDGPERAALEARAARLGLASRVRFLGAQPHALVFEWLRASDVFLSTSELTNRSLTTLEAMMCGLPVVATDSGSTAVAVEDGRVGFVTPADPARLAEPLARLIRDRALRRRMGQAAHAASHAFPGWEERVQHEVDLYHQLLDAPAAGARA